MVDGVATLGLKPELFKAIAGAVNFGAGFRDLKFVVRPVIVGLKKTVSIYRSLKKVQVMLQIQTWQLYKVFVCVHQKIHFEINFGATRIKPESAGSEVRMLPLAL